MGVLFTIIGAFLASVTLGAVGGLLGVTGYLSAMVGSYEVTLDGIKESIQGPFSSGLGRSGPRKLPR